MFDRAALFTWSYHLIWVEGEDAPNTDGIDLDCVRDAVVERSMFDTGDDAIAIKSGIDWFGTSAAYGSYQQM